MNTKLKFRLFLWCLAFLFVFSFCIPLFNVSAEKDNSFNKVIGGIQPNLNYDVNLEKSEKLLSSCDISVQPYSYFSTDNSFGWPNTNSGWSVDLLHKKAFFNPSLNSTEGSTYYQKVDQIDLSEDFTNLCLNCNFIFTDKIESELYGKVGYLLYNEIGDGFFVYFDLMSDAEFSSIKNPHVRYVEINRYIFNWGYSVSCGENTFNPFEENSLRFTREGSVFNIYLNGQHLSIIDGSLFGISDKDSIVPSITSFGYYVECEVIEFYNYNDLSISGVEPVYDSDLKQFVYELDKNVNYNLIFPSSSSLGLQYLGLNGFPVTIYKNVIHSNFPKPYYDITDTTKKIVLDSSSSYLDYFGCFIDTFSDSSDNFIFKINGWFDDGKSIFMDYAQDDNSDFGYNFGWRFIDESLAVENPYFEYSVFGNNGYGRLLFRVKGV